LGGKILIVAWVSRIENKQHFFSAHPVEPDRRGADEGCPRRVKGKKAGRLDGFKVLKRRARAVGHEQENKYRVVRKDHVDN
jgi:hypothetical protein